MGCANWAGLSVISAVLWCLTSSTAAAQSCQAISSPAPLNTSAETDGGNDSKPRLTTDHAGNWVAVWESDDDLANTIGTDADILFARSTDNGLTWSDPLPLNSAAGFDGSSRDREPQVVSDAAGTWLVVWNSEYDDIADGIDTDDDILVSRSIDNGATWSDAQPLNTTASEDDGDDTKPQLATDGAGTWLAVWVSKAHLNETLGTDNDILFAVSTDEGITWSAPQALNSTAGSDGNADDNEPQLTTDGAGRWLAVWKSKYNLDGVGGDDDIFFARSTNNGSTWTAAQALNTNAASDSGSDRKPQVTADGLGTWLAVWVSDDVLAEGVGTDEDIVLSVSTDHGAIWSDPRPLNTTAADDGAANDSEPQLTTDGAGNWIAIWKSKYSLASVGQDLGSDDDILFARSTDNGVSWTAPSALNRNADADSGSDSRPVLATDRAGHWVAVWDSKDTLGGTLDDDKDILVAVLELVDCPPSDLCHTVECVGVCVSTTIVCGDDDACTVDSCDPQSGCLNEPLDCDDGDLCTIDGCDPASGCTFEAVDCDDASVCTIDNCDAATGACVNEPIECLDGDLCTIDSCDPASGCTFEAVDCDDASVCTIDNCDAATGACVNEPIECLDGDLCTIDGCDPASGCTFQAVECDDGEICTNDGCDPATGECHNQAVNCDDGDGCTVDTCDPGSGACLNLPLDCDDGDACTVDTCDPATGCTYELVDCEDGDPCTVDDCDPATGCLNEPLPCDDGNPCNGIESCVDGQCLPGAIVDCNLNGSDDACDVAGGGSADCDGGGDPDECQVGPRVHLRAFVADPGFLLGIEQVALELSVSNSIPPDVADRFDVIVLASNSAMAAADAEVITDFVAAGGGLIIVQDTPPGAYLGQASPISAESGWITRTGTQVLLPEHPLVGGLGLNSTLQGQSTNPTLKSAAEIIIRWTDGTPMAVAYTYGLGQVVWFNDFWAFYQHNWAGDPQYGKTLMQNALFMVGDSPNDCNGNLQPDVCDIADGTSGDSNANQIPDECESLIDCPADLNGDGAVDASDMALLLSFWGAVDPPLGDLSGDGLVNSADLSIMLGAWGPCTGLLGACCNVDGAGGCELLVFDDCAAAGGSFLGTGTECVDCPPAACGSGAGACCEANGTPGCDDAVCCAAVCASDSFCCEVEWDSVCAGDATGLCDTCVPPPVNDECADAVAIFDGATVVSTAGATTDGPPNAACQFDGQTYNDVWFQYTATCSGLLAVSTCDQADYDTDLVIYSGCECTALEMLACNDDTFGCAGFTSQVAIAGEAGHCYLIRLGGTTPASEGTGVVTVTCTP